MSRRWFPPAISLRIPNGRRWWGGIRLHPRHLCDQKMKRDGREAAAEEEQERVDSISKRGRAAHPNDVVTYCDIARSGIRIDQVSVFRNSQGGRERTLRMTLADLRPSPTKTAPVVSKLASFILRDAIFDSLVLGDSIALGLPGLPRGSRFLDGLHIVIRHRSTSEEKNIPCRRIGYWAYWIRRHDRV